MQALKNWYHDWQPLLSKIITLIFRGWTVILVLIVIDQLGKTIWAPYKASTSIANYVWWSWLIILIVYALVTYKK